MVISVVDAGLSVVVMIFVGVVDRSVVSTEEDVGVAIVLLIVEISLDDTSALVAREVLKITVVDSSYVEDDGDFVLIVITLLVIWGELST